MSVLGMSRSLMGESQRTKDNEQNIIVQAKILQNIPENNAANLAIVENIALKARTRTSKIF